MSPNETANPSPSTTPTEKTGMRYPSYVLSLAGLLCWLVGASADDWPEFRGPTGQGHAAAKDLPVEWGKDKNVAWTTPIPGLGWSSPVVVGGRVYLSTAVSVKGSSKGDQSLRATCLDAGSGKILWDKEVFHQDGRTAPPIQSKNSHAKKEHGTNCCFRMVLHVFPLDVRCTARAGEEAKRAR